MRSMNSIEWRRGRSWGALPMLMTWTALAWVFFGLAVTPAAAVPANFDSTGTGFISSPELSALPTTTIDLSVPLFTAGDSGAGLSFDVDFTGSSGGEVCILTASQSGVCQADLTNVTTAYSAIVTLEISAINTSGITGPFTLLLTMLDLNVPNPGYAPDEVSIALDPTAPMPLDTSAVPGFNFDGTFSPFVVVEDQACTNSGGNCNYLGWTVFGVGDTATMRIDMSMAPDGRDSPRLLFNAVPLVVPEPGTALLMGLGLAGLALAGRQTGRERR